MTRFRYAAPLLVLATGIAAPEAFTPDACVGQVAKRETPEARGVDADTAIQTTNQSVDRGAKPYDRVITRLAKSDPGVFTVHRIKDRVYYEIPLRELGKPFLMVSRVAKNALAIGNSGELAALQVVRWEQKGDVIVLRGVWYSRKVGPYVTADRRLPIARAVDAASHEHVLMAFNVETLGPTGAPVIDVTPLFTTELPEFTYRPRTRARAFDPKRAFIERAASFPQNIEVDATHTFTSPPDQSSGSAAPRLPGSVSVLMHFSLIKLQEQPMRPRLFDERVYFAWSSVIDYGADDDRVVTRAYVMRRRLEKKDPAAAVSDPVNPIVFWIDPAMPEKWRPSVRRGVEQWQKAFTAAGFSNAILVKDAPTPEQDPDWSPDDVRYSVIRWVASPLPRAAAQPYWDPRSGELLATPVFLYQNITKLVRDWYFLQAGPLDARAQRLPLPDDLMGRLVEYVTTHEVGHALGLHHNAKASSLYPVDKLRDPEWLRTMGHTPTLMDYSRFNYVVQPEDHVDPALLIPVVGPADIWAIKWGYTPIPEATTPYDERKTLDEWCREQDRKPWLRATTVGGDGGVDPGQQNEAVGDADAVWATALGLKNLKRVADMLMPATARVGESYDDLGELYRGLLGQWATEMQHVAAIVGGFDGHQTRVGQAGVRFTPVSRERQKRAVAFLNEQAFATPSFLIRPEILRRIQAAGALDQVGAAQRRVLDALLNPARLARLVEQAAIDGDDAYQPTEFLADLRGGIWRELSATDVTIDAYRRNLQRTYIETLRVRIQASGDEAGDAPALFRGELLAVDRDVRLALARKPARMTALHLDDLRVRIAHALAPRDDGRSPARRSPQQQTTDGEAPGIDRRDDAEMDVLDSDAFDVDLSDLLGQGAACWRNYAIRSSELRSRP